MQIAQFYSYDGKRIVIYKVFMFMITSRKGMDKYESHFRTQSFKSFLLMIIKLEFISYLFYNRYPFDNNKKLLCGYDKLIAKNIFYDVSKLREKIDKNYIK